MASLAGLRRLRGLRHLRAPRSWRAAGGGPWRRRASTALAALAVLALATAALAHNGLPQADVSLNNGGVWVTSTSQHLVARLNYPTRQVDGAIRTSSQSFDVTQSGDDVLIPDSATSVVTAVDPVAVSLGGNTPLDSGSLVAQGGDRVMAVNTADGTVRATTVQGVAALPQSDPLVSGSAGLVAAIGTDGSIYAASPAQDTVTTLRANRTAWDKARTTSLALPEGTDLAITAVGTQPVVLERATGTLHLPGGLTTRLKTPGLVLQQPGPQADSVLVSSRTELLIVPLDGSAVTRLSAADPTASAGATTATPSAPASASAGPVAPGATEGIPARPVRLGECVYAAWSGSGQFVRQCDGSTQVRHSESLAAATQPVFRVNREAIVLNDVVEGNVWLPDENLVLVEDWMDDTSQTSEDAQDEDDSAQSSDSQSLPERTEDNHAPEAADESLGVRPGRSTVLNVLANDTDSDGDVLTVTPGDVSSAVKVTAAQDDRALRIAVPSGATGSFTVPYTVSDGRGGTASAVATVTVHPTDTNEVPVETTSSQIVVATHGSGSAVLLGAWQDPDGDTMSLVSAQGEGLDVRTTSEGTLAVRDVAGTVGTRQVAVVVTDGQQTATGTVTVDVKDPASVTPVANADHVRVVAGTSAQVSPLANDVSPTGEPLALTDVKGATEADSVSVDAASGVLTFSTTNPSPRTLYLTYTTSLGAAVTTGIVRVDVLARSESATPPVTEDDSVLLAAGASTTVEPLANDFDPSGEVLVLQSASVPPGTGLTATVVNHSQLQLTSTAPLSQPVDVTYTASNGSGSATGHVTVSPVGAEQIQEPIATADTAVVAVGDAVTVQVLDNDMSPSNLTLSLGGDIQDSGEKLGTAWVSDRTVRFRAGSSPGRTTLTYTVVDSQGQTASGEVFVEVRDTQGSAGTAPAPQPLQARTVAGTSVPITVPLDGIDPDGDSVRLVGLDQAPASGTVEVAGDHLTYTPAAGTSGTDTFSYKVEDRFGHTASAPVRVGVGQPPTTNLPPVPTADMVTARPGRTVVADVVSNDRDPDGDEVALTGAPVSSNPALAVSARGGRVVAELPTAEGVYTVHYQASDSRGGNATGTLTVRVTSDAPLVNPVGVDDYVTVDQVDASGNATIPVLDNDSDADGSPWELALSSQDSQAQVDGANLVVPVTDEAHVVMYTVTDRDGLTGHAVVHVPARSSLRPEANGQAISVTAGRATTASVGDYVRSRIGTTPVVKTDTQVQAGPGLEQAVASEDGTALTLTPAADFIGRTSVTVTVADGTGSDALASTLTLPVQVRTEANTPPSLLPTEVSVAPGEEPVRVNLDAMTSDADEDQISYSVGAAPEGFTVSQSGSVLTIGAADGATPPATGSLEVTASDSKNDPVSASLPLHLVTSTKPLMTTIPTTLTSDGSPVSVDIATLVSNPYPDQPLALGGNPSVSSGSGTVSTSGTVLTVSPQSGFTGRIVVDYQVLDASGDMERSVAGTVTVVVSSAPAAPTGVNAEPSGATSMSVQWVPGADNGSAVRTYTLTEVGGAGTWTCTGTPCTATGLAAGGSYSFQVVATNGVGSSKPSEPSTPVVLAATPTAPTGASMSDGQGQVTVRWSASPPVGGITPTYEVELSDGSSQTVSGTSATFRVSQPGDYSASVRAVAGSATSDWVSAGSAHAYAALGSPGTPQAQWTGSSLQISWAPATNNGDPVTYRVEVSSPVAYAGTTSATSVSLPASLKPGTHTVSITVTATNPAGTTSSTGSATFQVTSNPEPPSVNLSEGGVAGTLRAQATAVAGGGWNANQLRVQFRLSGMGQWQDSGEFSGLSAGTYTVDARAVAPDGSTSSVVTSNAVTVVTPPEAPTVTCSLSGTTASCGFAPGANSGQGTTYQGATSSAGGDATPIPLGHTHTVEAPGRTVTWCVRATNGAGSSAWGCASVKIPAPNQSFPAQFVGCSPEEAAAHPDLQTCGYVTFSASGFAPGSTISCGYGGVSQTFTTGANGGGFFRFPDPTGADPGSVTCSQR